VAHPQIAAFARLADGDAAPVRRLEGQRTLLGRTMHAIDYDEIHDEIVVPQQFGQAILTFRGSAGGEEPPVRVIQGSRTQLEGASRMGIDAVHDEIFIPSNGKILVFPREANGNVAPIRVLEGSDEVRLGGAMDVDPVNNVLVVATSVDRRTEASQLLIFDRLAQGRAKPRRAIRGPRTMLLNETKNIRIHPAGGWIVVAHDGVEAVGKASGLSFVGVWSIHDSGDVPPRWTIGGPHGALSKPRGVDLDPGHQTVIVSDKDLNGALTFHVPELFADPPSARGVQALWRRVAPGTKESRP
jgi:hypothetical protein